MIFAAKNSTKISVVLVLFACSLPVGCVSPGKKTLPEAAVGSGTAAAVSPLGSGQQHSGLGAIKDGGQKSVFVERLVQLEKLSTNASSTSTIKTVEGSNPSASIDLKLLSPLKLLMRSEKWSDLLLETNTDWKECLVDPKVFSESCREIGRARSLAHVRMGHHQLAWQNFDLLVDRGQQSGDALFFASLHLDAGSPELCSELATVGLSLEPAAPWLELSAIKAKCLRLAGRLSDARAFISRALREFPHESSLLVESAFVLLSENNLTDGCDILERLFLKETRQLAVFYNWGQCLVRRRDSVGAASILERGRREWPSERAWIVLSGEVALLEGRVQEARQLGLDYLSGSENSDLFRAQAEKLSRAVIGER